MEPLKLKMFLAAFLSVFQTLRASILEYPATVLEDANLDTPHLLMKYKYPAETHYVTTDDKYILQMHRIPKPNGLPVFLMHGLLDSSSTWVFMGPWSGFGYYLHDLGYDVWMGNARGNRYSRNHTTFDPSADKSFWKFSWHEIGYYDLPKMIDYVLEKTNKDKLTYFGHSQGTTSFFVMCSTRPAFNAKVKSMHALAPVAFMKHVKTPLVPLGRSFLNLKDMVPELLPYSDVLFKNCFLSKITFETCTDTLFQLMGKDPKQINATMWPVIFHHVPAGAALRQLIHYYQLIDSDRFCQYDHGAVENMKLYRAVSPPDYAIENIKIPIGLYYTYNDYLTSEVDVQRLARLLPNVVENNLYPYRKWNHLTVVWGLDSRQIVQKRLIEVMKKFE